MDAYPHEVSLDGAVKDARDVAQALKAAKVDTIRQFINEQATKDAIRSAWTELVAGAARGDTIVFTYAGHGAQMPELIAGSEEDGLDEFLELPGFDRSREEETSKEIIVDNELNAWFAEAEAKGIQVLFLSDSCFSGGMNRSISGKTRLAPIVRAKVPPPSEEALKGAKVKEAELSRVTILAASLESQPTPEVVIGGEPRGALSWSFARAIEGLRIATAMAGSRASSSRTMSSPTSNFSRKRCRCRTSRRKCRAPTRRLSCPCREARPSARARQATPERN